MKIDLYRTILGVTYQNRELVLAIALTESNCDYDIKHPDKTTCGIGGIKPLFWTEILGDTNPNSLQAIDKIISHLIDKNNGNIYSAIADYKGADTNMKTTDKCYKLYKQLMEKQ